MGRGDQSADALLYAPPEPGRAAEQAERYFTGQDRKDRSRRAWKTRYRQIAKQAPLRRRTPPTEDELKEIERSKEELPYRARVFGLSAEDLQRIREEGDNAPYSKHHEFHRCLYEELYPPGTRIRLDAVPLDNGEPAAGHPPVGTWGTIERISAGLGRPAIDVNWEADSHFTLIGGKDEFSAFAEASEKLLSPELRADLEARAK